MDCSRPARRILLLTHYFPPEVGAPQTRLFGVARELLARGHDIEVITGPPHYPDGVVRSPYVAWRPKVERIAGLRVTRVPVWVRPNGGLLDRSVDQGSFALAALAALPRIRAADVMIVESPPLFLGLTAAVGHVLTGRPYIFHVADPWPDFPIAMGALSNPAVAAVARAIESVAYRSAAIITTVTPGLVDLLEQNPAASGRVRLLLNGADLDRFDPTADSASARRSVGWREDRFHVAYVGTVGLAQGVGTLIEALAPLKDAGVELHVIGEGRERAELASDVRARGLSHIAFEPPVAANQVPRRLAASDALVVLLRDGWLFDRSLPTKLVEALAAGRPVVVSAGGEAARIVSEAAAGLACRAEDPAALRQAIMTLKNDPHRATMGASGRRLAESTFDRRAIVGQLEHYIDEAIERSGVAWA